MVRSYSMSSETPRDNQAPHFPLVFCSDTNAWMVYNENRDVERLLSYFHELDMIMAWNCFIK